MIMLHGRNAGPGNILELAGVLADPAFTYLAPKNQRCQPPAVERKENAAPAL